MKPLDHTQVMQILLLLKQAAYNWAIAENSKPGYSIMLCVKSRAGSLG